MADLDVLIDEAGAVWTAGSSEFHRHHNTFGSRVDLSSYVIRNLGHARLRVSKHGTQAYIAFRPGELNRLTVFAVSELLIKSDCSRITLEYVEDPPHLQQVSDLDDAIALLQDQQHEASSKRPRFFQEAISLVHIAHNPRLEVFARRHREWLRAHGRVTAKSEKNLLAVAKDRHTTTRVHGSYTTFESVGLGYSQIPAAGTKLEGKRLDSYPDARYGDWVSNCTMEAGFGEQPVFELVEATVSVTGTRPLRLRYDRLLLPWRGPGISYVSSTAAVRIIFPSHSG